MGIVKEVLYKLSGSWLFPTVKGQSIFPYYHLVRDDKVAHIENLYEYKNSHQFRSDIDFLLKHYQPIEPRALFEGDIPKKSFLLTFDDGLEEIYSVIFPILKEKNIKAIFFINPDFVGNEECLYKHTISVIINRIKETNYDEESLKTVASILNFTYTSVPDFLSKFKNLKYSEKAKLTDVLELLKIDINAYLQKQRPYISKSQIREMIDSGFYFGGHTMSHPPLNQLDFEQQKAEIIGSIEWLKSNFGLEYSCFAFPFSDRGITSALLNEMFAYDPNILIFGNSGLKKDISPRIIQRFSLENPHRKITTQIIGENLYKGFNRIIGKYKIKRK